MGKGIFMSLLIALFLLTSLPACGGGSSDDDSAVSSSPTKGAEETSAQAETSGKETLASEIDDSHIFRLQNIPKSLEHRLQS